MSKPHRAHRVAAGLAAALIVFTMFGSASPAAAKPDTASVNWTFSLRSDLNYKCLELLSFDNRNGAFAGMWDCWGGSNQQWYWDGNMLRNAMNNKCLDVLTFNNNNGAIVGLWDCLGGANQRWYWDGRMLRSYFNHKCLEVLSFNGNNGAWAGMWDCWGGPNQRWF